jgi:hypothetical protein
MPENIGATGAPYNTKIPRIDENADIQTALRLYHYGLDTSNPESIINNSIAGHLNSLELSKINRAPVVIGTNQNINEIVTTGYYNQPSTVNARTGSNYPEFPDSSGVLRFFAGLLKVVNDNNIVFQEYHMVGDTGYPVNVLFWRYRFGGTWSSWRRALLGDADVVAITDFRYYRTSQTYNQTESDARFSPRLFEENVRTANYTLALGDINKVVSMNVSGTGTLTVPTNSAVAFPTGTIINVYNQSAALLTVAGASGVTVRNAGTLEQYKEASLRKRAADEWVAAGPLY